MLIKVIFNDRSTKNAQSHTNDAMRSPLNQSMFKGKNPIREEGRNLCKKFYIKNIPPTFIKWPNSINIKAQIPLNMLLLSIKEGFKDDWGNSTDKNRNCSAYLFRIMSSVKCCWRLKGKSQWRKIDSAVSKWPSGP
jgi:hypothetical protein